jgi:amino-acid N-acetyltransferase
MSVTIRKAQLSDVKAMQVLVNSFADRNRMLALSLSELYDKVRDFTVACEEGNPGGKVLGCCALRIFWEDLAEIRSLAVVEDAQQRGFGRDLVKACIAEAQALGVGRVFALTYVPDFFTKLGFCQVDKAELPHKVWVDCLKCARFPHCDEVAVTIDF